jgi:hypothetical protein
MSTVGPSENSCLASGCRTDWQQHIDRARITPRASRPRPVHNRVTVNGDTPSCPFASSHLSPALR